jgi:stage III sporulation protein AB
MKYLLIAIIVMGVSYIGYGISRYYRKRKRYFEDLILLSERLSVDISFSKDNLQTILKNSIDSYGNDLKSSIKGYMEFLKNNEKELSNNLIFKKSSLIKDEEKETVFLFFKSLGRLDASNQVSEINNFKIKFVSLRDDAENDNKKFGSLSFKLAILFALMIIILLI